mgnify:CR=1 FL=1
MAVVYSIPPAGAGSPPGACGGAFARFLGLCVLLAALFSLSACATPQKEEEYIPKVGQAGKDVVWVPTPDEMVTLMLKTAGVHAGDLVYDLGAGDGKIAIAAASQFGARAVGIEYNPQLAEVARRNVKRAGLEEKIRIVTGDIFVEDFSRATVVTLYLLPELNLRLKPTLLAMKPGTRIVSHSFDMGTWEPDTEIKAGGSHGFYWIVPADVRGRWAVQLPGQSKSAVLDLGQNYQKLSGTLTVDGRAYPIEEARMAGAEMRFSCQCDGGQRASFSLRVASNGLSGQMRGPQRSAAVQGQRL